MRRITCRVVVGIVASLTLAVPTASSAPGADAGVYQIADADWVVRTGPTTGVWYIVSAMRFGPAAPDGMVGVAFIGRGRCTFRTFKHGSSVSCQASGRGQRIGPSEFQIDPLLSSAVLDVDAKGFSHHVEWTGRGDYPYVGQSIGAYGPAFMAGVGLMREASAAGDVFGKHLQSKRFSFTYLAQGADAQASTTAFGFDATQSGLQRVHRTFWIPR